MSRSLGIPVKLLHEAAGHIVTVELKSGELYRGSMIECEDNWNCQLESITFTSKVTPFFISLFFFFLSESFFECVSSYGKFANSRRSEKTLTRYFDSVRVSEIQATTLVFHLEVELTFSFYWFQLSSDYMSRIRNFALFY